MKNKNIKLAESFYNFCKANPELRFWQALSAWASQKYILVSNQPPHEIHDNIIAGPFAAEFEIEDTFYWENKNK